MDLSYAEDNDQVAEWLEDYKHIKQWKSDIMDEFDKKHFEVCGNLFDNPELLEVGE